MSPSSAAAGWDVGQPQPQGVLGLWRWFDDRLKDAQSETVKRFDVLDLHAAKMARQLDILHLVFKLYLSLAF